MEMRKREKKPSINDQQCWGLNMINDNWHAKRLRKLFMHRRPIRSTSELTNLLGLKSKWLLLNDFRNLMGDCEGELRFDENGTDGCRIGN